MELGPGPSGAASLPSTTKNVLSRRSASVVDPDFDGLGQHFRLPGFGFEGQVAAGHGRHAERDEYVGQSRHAERDEYGRVRTSAYASARNARGVTPKCRRNSVAKY